MQNPIQVERANLSGRAPGQPANPVRAERARIIRLGLALYVITAIVVGLLAMKPQIKTLLNGGDTTTAEFSSQYKLRAHDSSVKTAGITVGMVTDLDETDDGTTLVRMKVDEGIVDKLGSTPTANIEPRTPLLQRRFGDAGPTPESSDWISDLLESAPDVLRPSTPVFEAAQGTRPRKNLDGIVTRLDATARALTRTDGQLDATVADLATTSRTLALHLQALDTVLGELSATLEQAWRRDGGAR